MRDALSMTALEQADLVRRGEVSSEELVRASLERVAAQNGALAAFVSVFPRRAIAQARAWDRRRRRGERLPLFAGVPTAIKDLNFVRLSWTRMGSRGVPPLFSPVDDVVVRAVRRGGFVIVGKTATSEVGAMPVTEPDTHPPTRNPWDLSRAAGGSSGGAAAAVASGMVPIAHGSDGAGSIRLPAAFCHLFGLKPSRGRVPNAFGKTDRDVLYTCGPIATNVADAAAMLDVMAGLDAEFGGRPHWAPPPEKPYHAQTAPPARLVIRFSTKAPLGVTHPDVARAVEDAARALADLGHDVEEAPLPSGTLEEFLPLWQQLVSTAPVLSWARTQPITRWLGEAGKRLKDVDVRARHRELTARFDAAFDAADVWLTPTTPEPAPRVGAFANRPPAEAFEDAARIGAFTAAMNVTGRPAASVPLGLTADGLPMGAQIAGRAFADDVVLAVARQLEAARPWAHRRAGRV